MSSTLLHTLDLPLDLRGLTREQLIVLSDEIRCELIHSVALSGGHLAPSLGVVELTISLHRLFNTPRDRIVWDVGHQGYVHKLLTGRRDLIPSIRSHGGIAGYLKRSESEYDCFGAGHAGTAISAALGMRLGLQKAGAISARDTGDDPYVVAVVGDGAMTAGMCFEALNHAGSFPASELSRLIVILNDNGMSISLNVGALSKSSAQLRAPSKDLSEQSSPAENLRAQRAPTHSAPHPRNLFHTLGFHYIGPVDGHDFSALETALLEAKARRGPVLLHVLTTKGKGLPAAERDPVKWHGIAAQPSPAPAAPVQTFSTYFARSLLDIAKADSRVVAITAAMPTGTGLDLVGRELPCSFIDVGICEQHAVTLAAGLACEGMRPVVAIYSTFLQRGFDQLLHDVCLQNLPVVFALDRAGLVGSDGETHQGVFDLAYLRAIPNLTIMAPRDEHQLDRMLRAAILQDGPAAIRFPRANGIGTLPPDEAAPIEPGTAEVLAKGNDGLIITLGPLAYRALALAEWISERYGEGIEVIDARFVKPLDPMILDRLAAAPWSLILEDHSRAGGFGSAVLEAAHDAELLLRSPIVRAGVPDRFISHGTIDEQHGWCGLDEASLKRWYEELRRRRASAIGMLRSGSKSAPDLPDKEVNEVTGSNILAEAARERMLARAA